MSDQLKILTFDNLVDKLIECENAFGKEKLNHLFNKNASIKSRVPLLRVIIVSMIEEEVNILKDMEIHTNPIKRVDRTRCKII